MFLELTGPNREPFTCLDLNCTDSLLATGSEKMGEDAAVTIWSGLEVNLRSQTVKLKLFYSQGLETFSD